MYLRNVSRRTASHYILSVICTALEFQRFIDVYTYKFEDRKTLTISLHQTAGELLG